VVASREARESSDQSAVPATGESRAVGPGHAVPHDAAAQPDAAAPQDPALAQGPIDDGHRMIARLADEMLPVLIARLGQSSLGELEVRENGWRVRLRRPTPLNGAAPAGEAGNARRAEPGATPRAARAGASRAGAARAATDGGSKSAAAPDGRRGLVTSPAVGYFLLRDGMAVKAQVRQGDLIGHVDVLGVRQEVVAGHDGVVRRLEVESGQAVEYGQPIARIEPESRG